MSIEDEGLLKKFKGLSFAASFRWVFSFSPGEDGAEHEPVGEGTLGGFSSGRPYWVLLLLRWVFGIDFGDYEALTEGEQERFGKRPPDEKSRDVGAWAISCSWADASVWTFGLFRCIHEVNSEDEG